MSHDGAGPRSVDGASFRGLMRSFPSGVSVVTCADRHGRPDGLTCSSLCSVSMSPPLLLVCVKPDSRTLLMIRDQGAFAVNFLHEGGREAAERFASRTADRFQGIPWCPTPGWSLPALVAHAHAVAQCAVREVVDAGDHVILLGQVMDIVSQSPAPPLLYGLGRYAMWPDETSPVLERLAANVT